MLTLTFKCGADDCDAKLPPVEAAQVATQVVKRTCRKCGTRWQLVVKPIMVREGARVDMATLSRLEVRRGPS